MVFLVAQRDPEVDAPEPDDLHRVGTVGTVMRILRMGDGRVKVLVQGIAKARVESFVEQERSLWVRVGAFSQPESSEWCVEGEALMRAVRARVEERIEGHLSQPAITRDSSCSRMVPAAFVTG